MQINIRECEPLYVSRSYSLSTTSTLPSSPSGLSSVIVVLGANSIFVMISLSIFLLFLPSLASAYTFKFTSVPTQCQELSLAIEGQGSPPYQVLIIPVGPSTAPNNVEVRKVIDQTFPDNGTTVSFPLRFPANSQFVAVVRLSTVSFFLFILAHRHAGLRPVRLRYRWDECFCNRPV